MAGALEVLLSFNTSQTERVQVLYNAYILYIYHNNYMDHLGKQVGS